MYLERLGIRHIFGLPGAHILPVYDSLYDSTIHSILVKHEQGAAFMAGGAARSSGQISACITTAGPGATNLVTGIANAYADNLPLLVITGESPTHIFGRGGLQESSGEGSSIDQRLLFQGITRYHKIVERTDYLQSVLVRATQELTSARPGPVVLSLPYNLQKEEVDEAILDALPLPDLSTSPLSPASPITSNQAEQILQMLQQAKHPVALVGHGCLQAGVNERLTQFCEHHGIAVATSLKGKGAIDENHPLSLGTLGVTSNGAALQTILEQSDLLLILGASINERTSYLWKSALFTERPIIQIDHNHNQLNKTFRATLAVEMDIGVLLDALLEHPTPAETTLPSPSPLSTDNPILRTTPQSVQELFRYLNHFEGSLSLFDDNIIYGQNLFMASTQHHYFPNSGISSLGHALPAAVGASLQLNHPVFALLGDGGFQMCGMELMTAVNYNIPLNVVVLNNGAMGLIRKNQFQQYQGRYIDCDFITPNLSLLAQSFGIHHQRIDRLEDFDSLGSTLDLHKGINLVEITVDKNAFPDYQSGR